MRLRDARRQIGEKWRDVGLHADTRVVFLHAREILAARLLHDIKPRAQRRIEQRDFSPERAAQELAALLDDPARLTTMASGAKSAGTLDAADRLAALVLKTAGA
jgi:UDP-N-acetylglucosamine:LPS N-acetylglucosamine transferase